MIPAQALFINKAELFSFKNKNKDLNKSLFLFEFLLNQKIIKNKKKKATNSIRINASQCDLLIKKFIFLLSNVRSMKKEKNSINSYQPKIDFIDSLLLNKDNHITLKWQNGLSLFFLDKNNQKTLFSTKFYIRFFFKKKLFSGSKPLISLRILSYFSLIGFKSFIFAKQN